MRRSRNEIILVQNPQTGFIVPFKDKASIVRYFKNSVHDFPVYQFRREILEFDKPIIKKKQWIITLMKIRNE